MNRDQQLETLRSDYVSLVNEYKRLRDLLDCRPAMNAGLTEAYAKWTAAVYMSDFVGGDDGQVPQ